MTKPLDELNELLEKQFYNFDLQAVRIMLGAVKSHYLDSLEPVWLLLVGPGSSGKTETLKLLTGLDQAQKLDVFNEEAFLKWMKYGFLEMFPSEREGNVDTIRGNTLFVYDNVEDPFPKPAILSLLQELHTGEFRRTVKTKEKIWKGKVTIIGASRPVPLPDVLREEFLQVKLRTSTDPGRGVKTLQQMGHAKPTPADLRRVVKKLFDAPPSSPMPTLSAEQEQRILDLFPDTAPQLAALAQGIATLTGQDQVEEQDLQDALRVGKDTKGDEE
jgi:hypothetical protein